MKLSISSSRKFSMKTARQAEHIWRKAIAKTRKVTDKLIAIGHRSEY